ncbi:hypothetical protein KEJ15_08515 [Candidatus Bathyarchaeota archaeon]|nr:hypothetical protein [Candidatus Bathyarchaeota archaeon]
MDEKSKLLKYVLLLLIWSSYINSTCINETLAVDLYPSKLKEAIYVYVFFALPPIGDVMLCKNTHLAFNDITKLPVNTTLPAFNNGFIEARSEIIRAGDKCFLSINVYYNLNLTDVAKANEHADECSHEFLRVFGYTLNNIHQYQIINNETNIIRVGRQFGYIPYSVSGLTPFLRYKPNDGLAILIDNMISVYVPGTSTIGFVDLFYEIEKNQSGFTWSFVIGGSKGEILSKNGIEEINLNGLLNNDVPIVGSQQSAISLEIQRFFLRKNGEITMNYSLEVISVHPDESKFVSESNEIQVIYDNLTGPIDNVIVQLEVGIQSNSTAWLEKYWFLIVVIVGGIMGGLLTVLYLNKRWYKATRFSDRKSQAQQSLQ